MHRKQVLQPRPRLPSRLLLFFSRGPLSQAHVFLTKYEYTSWKGSRKEICCFTKNCKDSEERRLLVQTACYFTIYFLLNAFLKLLSDFTSRSSCKHCWSPISSGLESLTICNEKWRGKDTAMQSASNLKRYMRALFPFVQHNFMLTMYRSKRHHVEVYIVFRWVRRHKDRFFICAPSPLYPRLFEAARRRRCCWRRRTLRWGEKRRRWEQRTARTVQQVRQHPHRLS